MTSAKEYYGKYFNPRKQCSLNRLDSFGKPLSCTGVKTGDECKWYGLIGENGNKVDVYNFTICECCAITGFDKSTIYEIKREEHPELPWYSINCEMPKTETCLKYGVDKRCLHYNNIRLNLNLVDPYDNDDYRPVLLVPEMEKVKHNGIACYGLPTMSYWELAIKADPKGIYNDIKYYMIVDMHDKQGRMVHIRNQYGQKNYYTPMSNIHPMTINSYDSGEGQRFMFSGVSNEEIQNQDITSGLHLNKSNVFEIKIRVYERIVYQEPKTRSIHQPTRGYSSGTNMSAPGYSSSAYSNTTKDSFVEVDTIDITLQLVCNQSNEERLKIAKEIEINEMEGKRHELLKLEQQKQKLLQPSKRGELLGIEHKQQEEFLMNFDL